MNTLGHLCASLLLTFGGFSLALAAPLDDWVAVLENHVDEAGRTDFRALAREPETLQRYVAWLAVNGPQSTPADFSSAAAVLAFHINAYNALAMNGVIERGIPNDFSSFFKRASFFRFRAITVDGLRTNLYDYENNVIRPLGEPRVHFVLNCMVRDCPRLPRTPFMAATLEQDLEALTREFLNQPKYVLVDNAIGLVKVSAILDFYTRDFVASGRARDLLPWINRYRDEPLKADHRIEFLDYDWRINQQP